MKMVKGFIVAYLNKQGGLVEVSPHSYGCPQKQKWQGQGKRKKGRIK